MSRDQNCSLLQFRLSLEGLSPIRVVMPARQPAVARRPRRSVRSHPKPYMLVSRARDGRLRTERFDSADEYRRQLASTCAKARPVSLDDLVNLLDL